MASRRDLLLQQLGITQWTLRRPAVLQGEIAVRLPEGIRLLVVAQTLPEQDDPLLCDVLRSLGLTPLQAYALTPDQVAMLPADTQCNSWRLGISEPLAVAGAQLHSPPLAGLYQDASAKRALWQQICHHEADFYPDASRSGHSVPN
ncbi:DNA polymerase III subunit psi [Yersinia massiliensis]|jgi:DNA polymerase-3 subunit psi|uniref:DNA polymerase III subunit psi n=2 Tax=Yersinia TaxID=629 RepID=A0A2R4NTZ4_9GAMM|nr:MULTISPECIES: DNA polymerase III subunit psi [Yersinia]HEC1651054.1 DNA polymerase III subunit psi [Yersinia enterocolitica]ATM88585.1 DNA polymerase III subunit psi [Yersinia frederiksenii]AVX39609.1 DNA polymerase III subunit psi [Yersinia massiliensis]MCB5316736.1 DNA polymerase III subunit psi [Yersinia massiliensis]MDA5548231.1 DNA polymerase III subunit psi [Yersinia massiliensis]